MNRAERTAPAAGDESLVEEVANAVTHGVGATLAVAGLALLVVLAAMRDSAWAVVAVSIYGATLVLAYLASALYHGTWHEKAKRVFLSLDHCTIYLLIAGTYTPFTLLVLPSPLGPALCAAVWALALAGIVLRLWSRRLHPLAIPLYLLMGWVGMGWAGTLFDSLGAGGGWLIVAGGLAYTSGLVFYAWRRLPFNHAVWHLFVLGGSVCHFLAVALYALPAATS
ncbi:MAG: PAQR family membrane homeostasis protein TrhA [Alphaproteobacteria bacterium]